MQTRGRRSLIAPLTLAAIIVLSGSIALAIPLAGSHGGTGAAFGAKPVAAYGATTTQSLLGHPVDVAKAGTPPTLYYSGNWAGYAVEAKTAGTIYEVYGEWSVPSVTCGESVGPAYQSVWIGIDGFANGNVSQLGTTAYCSGPGATPSYFSWYEWVPYENSVEIAPTSAGALITAYVLYNPTEAVDGVPGVYTLELYDVDHGVNFVTSGGGWVCSGSYCEGGPDASAECISEAPMVSGSIAKLADYGTTTFDVCAMTIGAYFGGVGNQAGHGTVYIIDQVGAVSDAIIQKTSGLTDSWFGASLFSIKWQGYH
jgi:Peptidase A4 family